MKSRKSKALFAINGYGMGNATRCEALMDILADEIDAEIITSDRAFKYFYESNEKRTLHKQEDINNSKNNNYGSLSFYIFSLIPFIIRLFNNRKRQCELWKANAYEYCFFDSDYAFVLHRLYFIFQKKRPCLIGVNNSFDVISYFRTDPGKLQMNLIPSFLVEVLDYVIYSTFCDYVLFPSLNFENKLNSDKIKQIPPLIRSSILNYDKNKAVDAKTDSTFAGLRAAAFVSSSNVVSLLHEFLKKINRKIDFKTKNEQELNSAELIISNAGQSTLSEALYLAKKSLIFPIPRHAEQAANAGRLAKLGALSIDSSEELNVLQIESRARELKNLVPVYSYAELKASVTTAFVEIKSGKNKCK